MSKVKIAALTTGAIILIALVTYGIGKYYSRSTLPEGYPVGSGDGTEFEGEDYPSKDSSAEDMTSGDTATTGADVSAAGSDDGTTAGDALGTTDATQGITDIEYSPEYLAVIEKAEEHLSRMTTEEKVAQLFFISIDALTEVGNTVIAGDVTSNKLKMYPVGGVILFAKNITDPVQVTEFTKKLHDISGADGRVPVMIGLDEEGGTVVRIAGRDGFPEKNVGAMAEIGKTGDPEKARETGEFIGSYLKKYGFDIDFAPVVDVYTNPENTVIGTRAFGTTPELVREMAEAFREGLEAQGIQSCIKHYPGHGDTQADSHYGTAVTYKTLDELMACELIPFQESIRTGAEVVMVSHVSTPKVTGDMEPASLSSKMVDEILRGELGFDGVAATDDLSMKAIMDEYGAAEACIKSIQAGVDWVMLSTDFVDAYNGVLAAVQNGTISAERLDESVKRILILKGMNGLL